MQKQFVLWMFSGSSAISLRLPFVVNVFDRGFKHWLSLYQQWKISLRYQLFLVTISARPTPTIDPHRNPLIGYTERLCQDSWPWPSSSVPSRIFPLCWWILLLLNLTQQQHICLQTISTHMSEYCSPSDSRTNHRAVFSNSFRISVGIHQGNLSKR